MQKITPFLWFNDQAEEAAKFYTSIFKNSRITGISHYTEAAEKAARRPKGSVMTVTFQLDGQDFTALNGGPLFKFSEAVSLVVNCDSQQEIDYYWSKLSAGGAESQCGWLKDRYGFSWQIVPKTVIELLSKNDAKAERVMAAVLKMRKLDFETLVNA